MKPRIKLRIVAKSQRPLAALSRAEKVAAAIGWLRSRNRYVLDAGSARPKWGVPGDPQKRVDKTVYRGKPSLIERMADGIKSLWAGY